MPARARFSGYRGLPTYSLGEMTTPEETAEIAELAALVFPDDPSPSILPSAEGTISFEGDDPYPEPVWDDVLKRLAERIEELQATACEAETRLG